MSDESYRHFLAERRARILAHIADAAARAGREASDIEVVAVSKTVGIEEVVAAYQVGYHAFGENRPQELRRKAEGIRAVPDVAGACLHMIGNLQKNKINQVLESGASLVHSLSSEALAEAVSRRAEARGLVVRGLLEVNVSGEESKAGMTPEEARRIAQVVEGMAGVELVGLMAMAPAGDPDAARRTFSGLRELRDELREGVDGDLPVLSCGMSDDFEIAVEEGSTLVRLGRIVFDPAYAYE